MVKMSQQNDMSPDKSLSATGMDINPLDILKYLLANWYWFVLSVLVFGGIAWYRYSTMQKTYSASASVMFKDTKAAAAEARLDRLTGYNNKANVSNEILELRSGKLMQDALKRLGGDVSYVVMDYLREEELYTQSPVKVVLPFAEERQEMSFTATPLDENRVRLTNFSTLDKNMEVRLGDSIDTELGKMVVTPTLYYSRSWYGKDVLVRKLSLTSVAANMSSRLNVYQADEEDASSILNMNLVDTNPFRAEDILNMLITIYNEQTILDKNQSSINTTNFINERLQIIEEELGGVESQIEAYKVSNNMIDLGTEAGVSQSEKQQYGTMSKDLQREAAMGQYIRDYLTDPSKANELIPSQTVTDASIEAQIQQYNAAKLKRDKLIEGSSDKNPVVQDLNNTLNSMRQSIIRSVDNMNLSTEVRLRDAQNRAGQAAGRISIIPSQQREMQNIQRQQRIKEELYLYLLNRREENALLQATTESNARVIEPAHGSEVPISPNERQMIMTGVAEGIALPAVILLFFLFFDTRVKDRRDIEDYISVPFLGEIPKSSTKQTKSFKNSIVVTPQSRDVASEAFRIIRTNMDFMRVKSKDMKVITFSSFGAGAGKTYISSNLAACFAQSDKKVLLIDLDIRKGTLSSNSQHEKSRGMTTYLSGQAELKDVLKPNELGENFDFIPSGYVAPNPAELLLSERLDAAIAELRPKYDYIFVDNVPYNAVADAAITNRIADLTIFVVRVGKLDRRMLPDIEKIYTTGKLNNMSLILNGSIVRSRGYGSGYGYGYG
ncbi:MAG: polysaccharide biosynthesis tyrosine autokinase [Bacteroidales bacterium]|nr:polysaccharide biosynthesis tyrosine autokinase [Bacteroidales bacterium]